MNRVSKHDTATVEQIHLIKPHRSSIELHYNNEAGRGASPLISSISACLLPHPSLVTSTCRLYQQYSFHPSRTAHIAAIMSAAQPLRMVPLIAKPQQYAWGKVGKDSEVAKVLKAGGQSVDDDKPYAELWMGTHPSAPSAVRLDSSSQPTPLSSYLQSELPYLFKILSIRTALSIQAHPDIPLARRLHKENPKEYKDDNHKPEMATAITPFEALCGFRPHEQVAWYVNNVPQLKQVVGDAVVSQYVQAVQGGSEEERRKGLKEVFRALMTAKEETFKPALHSLLSNLPATDPYAAASSDSSASAPLSINVFTLLPRLQQQYPNDIGIFCPFLLNCFSAPPFSSLFLPANEPHAYLSGDIVECMACSDNVVRAGLTPKFRDVTNLVDMLTYEARTVSYTTEQSRGDNVVEYVPPIPEFVLSVGRAVNGATIRLLPSDSHGILLVWKGSGGRVVRYADGSSEEGGAVSAGDVWLVPRGAELVLTGSGSGEEGLIVFKCAENDGLKGKGEEKKANL